MKKYLLFLGIIGLFSLTACGKQVKMSDVTIDYGSSSIYSKEDMDAAIKAIKTVFKDFDGCELHSISYSSDDQCSTPDHIAWMNELEAANDNKETFDQCIIINICQSADIHFKYIFDNQEP